MSLSVSLNQCVFDLRRQQRQADMGIAERGSRPSIRGDERY
jgi:hypothetical protein